MKGERTIDDKPFRYGGIERDYDRTSEEWAEWIPEMRRCYICGGKMQIDEPKTQMKTQNSNLTFEKDECAKEYEELGLKELKALIEADRKDEPTCDTCRHKGVEGCEQPCLGCGCCGLYEAMTGNDKLKEKVVEFIKSCARCKHRPIGAMMCEESCHYEPKDEPQTYVINPQEPTNDEKCFECDDFFTCGGQCNKIEDEPHAEIPEYAEWKEPFEKMTDCPWK